MKYLLFSILLMAIFSCSDSKTMKEYSDYQDDIKFLRDTLPVKHPNLFFHQDKATFRKTMDFIASKENLSSKDSSQILMQLREATAQIGDPHTNFGFYEYIDAEGHYPIEIFWFADGVWIVGADEKYKSLIGKKLVAINGMPMAKVIEEVTKVVPKNEPYFSHKRLHYFLPKNAILTYYAITSGNAATFTVETLGGEKEEVEVDVANSEYNVDEFVRLEQAPYYWQSVLSDTANFFRLHYFEEDSILFVQYNRCWGKELEEKYGDPEEAEQLPSFNAFQTEIFETIKNRPVNKLLFDLRFNGGGSSLQGTELIEALSKIERINEKGKLFVAISQHTFSSAVINAMNFRQNTEAILLGQPSGGSPNHYGEGRTLVLPKTKMEVYHSTQYFKYTDEDLKAVMPDVTVETEFATIANGKDPIYEYVKTYRKS
ncbi:MAG: hypothetical protein AAGD05_07220 [Bacteroidota bacterium]